MMKTKTGTVIVEPPSPASLYRVRSTVSRLGVEYLGYHRGRACWRNKGESSVFSREEADSAIEDLPERFRDECQVVPAACENVCPRCRRLWD